MENYSRREVPTLTEVEQISKQLTYQSFFLPDKSVLRIIKRVLPGNLCWYVLHESLSNYKPIVTYVFEFDNLCKFINEMLEDLEDMYLANGGEIQLSDEDDQLLNNLLNQKDDSENVEEV